MDINAKCACAHEKGPLIVQETKRNKESMEKQGYKGTQEKCNKESMEKQGYKGTQERKEQ